VFAHNSAELGQLVEKQHPSVGQGDLDRAGARPAADERRQRGIMMRVDPQINTDNPFTNVCLVENPLSAQL
jgi:hypothetical protein